MTGCPFELTVSVARISFPPADDWHACTPGAQVILALRLSGSTARLFTTKVVVPSVTWYCESTQDGIVKDLSVQRPAGHVGVDGMSMPRVLAANSSAEIIVVERMVSTLR